MVMMFTKRAALAAFLLAATQQTADAFAVTTKSSTSTSSWSSSLRRNMLEDYYDAFGESSSSSHSFPTQGNLNPPAKPLKRYGESMNSDAAAAAEDALQQVPPPNDTPASPETVTTTQAVPGFTASYTSNASSIDGKMVEDPSSSFQQPPQPGTHVTGSSPYNAQAELYYGLNNKETSLNLSPQQQLQRASATSPYAAQAALYGDGSSKYLYEPLTTTPSNTRIPFQADKDGMMLEHDVLPKKNRFVPISGDTVSSGSDMTTTHGRTSGVFRKIKSSHASEDPGQNVNLGEVVPTPKFTTKPLRPDTVSSGSDATTTHTSRVGAFSHVTKDAGDNILLDQVVPTTPKLFKKLAPDTISSGSDATTSHENRVGAFAKQQKQKVDAGQNILLNEVVPSKPNPFKKLAPDTISSGSDSTTVKTRVGAFRHSTLDAGDNINLGDVVPLANTFKKLTPDSVSSGSDQTTLSNRVGAFSKHAKQDAGQHLQLGDTVPTPKFTAPLQPDSVSSGSDSTTLKNKVGYFSHDGNASKPTLAMGEAVPSPQPTVPLDDSSFSSNSSGDSPTATTKQRVIGAFRTEDAAGNRVMGTAVPAPQVSPPLSNFRAVNFQSDSGMNMDLGASPAVPKPKPIPPLTPQSVRASSGVVLPDPIEGMPQTSERLPSSKSVWDAPPAAMQPQQDMEQPPPVTDEQS